VVLVDATKLALDAGPLALLPQTRRHALLAQLLRVPHIVFAVNKLDAVAEPARAFARIRDALVEFADDAGIVPAGIVPISALRGDNVTRPAPLAGYDGPTLLALLEQLPDDAEPSHGGALLPVQYVANAALDAASGAGHRARMLWGRIARGHVEVGDALAVFPSGETARVAELHEAGRRVDRVEAGRSAGVVFDRQLDVSRGDWLAAPGTLRPASRFAATLAWLDTEPALVGRRYWLRHGNRWLQGRIVEVTSRLDIATLAPQDAEELAVNDIGEVVFETQQPLPLESFATQRVAGALLVVDPASNRTSGALLVKAPL
jgi:sulfate adenylyltransferase subunit 1